ncbi:NUDIX domain-containing protein [Candidatus Woesearchaeota archaeon]|nr:NUDIX domain-containing protein [Candidatus Woesearchaeota archaeon]
MEEAAEVAEREGLEERVEEDAGDSHRTNTPNERRGIERRLNDKNYESKSSRAERRTANEDKDTSNGSKSGRHVNHRKDRKEQDDKSPYKNEGSSRNYRKSNKKENQVKYENIDGAIAVILYRDPKTGKIKFYLEIKSYDYPIKSEIGKFSLVGGGIEENESSLEALVREIKEEIVNKKAQTILLDSLKENPKPVYVAKDYFNGYESNNFVYVIQVKSKEDWKAVSSSGMAPDAGIPAVMSLEKVVKNIEAGNFAFNHGEIIAEFISDYLRGRFTPRRNASDSSYYGFDMQAQKSLSQQYTIDHLVKPVPAIFQYNPNNFLTIPISTKTFNFSLN